MYVTILMATHYFASHNGGIEIVAGRLYQELASAGQEVVWIASAATSPPAQLGKSRPTSFGVLNFIERGTGIPFLVPTLSALITIRNEVKHADVVIVHDCLYLSNIAVFLLARMRSVPTVIIQHIGVVPYKNLALRALMKIGNAIVTHSMLTKSQQVVFISETTKAFFSGLHFKNPPEVIFNGVDTSVFRALEQNEAKVNLRRNYDLPIERRAVLYVGRFVEKKGISVIRRMVEQRPNWTWVFAGWGPLDPAQWNAPNVRVFSNLRGPSMAALYRACDMLVLPSVGEGFPLVIQEALASGLPVVCGDETLGADPAMGKFVRGAPIIPGDDERTASGFLAAIEESFASDEESAQSRRDFAVRNYSWDRTIRQYLEIISRLVPQATVLNEKSQAEVGNP